MLLEQKGPCELDNEDTRQEEDILQMEKDQRLTRRIERCIFGNHDSTKLELYAFGP